MRVQHAIFPGFALGTICLVLVAGWITNPQYQQQVAVPAAAVVSIPFVVALPGQEPSTQDAALEAAQGAVQELGAQDAVALDAVLQAAESQDSAASHQCGISQKFPQAIQQWCALIDRYASEHGIEASLVAAVMLQESGGNPDAYSKSGAVGLMQVMPRDGKAASFQCVNGPCFASRPSMAELYDPEFNIAYGARMLAGLTARYGSTREALRAYGPMDMGYRYADIVLGLQQQYE